MRVSWLGCCCCGRFLCASFRCGDDETNHTEKRDITVGLYTCLEASRVRHFIRHDLQSRKRLYEHASPCQNGQVFRTTHKIALGLPTGLSSPLKSIEIHAGRVMEAPAVGWLTTPCRNLITFESFVTFTVALQLIIDVEITHRCGRG